MKRDAVRLEVDVREFVLDAIIDKLTTIEVELLAAALTRDHLHLLGRFRFMTRVNDWALRRSTPLTHCAKRVYEQMKAACGASDQRSNRFAIESTN